MWKKILASLFIGASLFAISSTVHSAALTNTTNATKTEQTTKTDQTTKTEQTTKTDQTTKTEQTTKTDQAGKTEPKVDISKYQVINPEKNAYSTEDKVAFINGKAPSGTSIVIQVYGTTRKNFDLLTLPTEDDYIEILSETVKSGNLGFFDKQLELVAGINKIVIDFGVEEVPTVEIIVYLKTPDSGNSTKEVKITDIIQKLK